jgi:hypothetical protein
MWDPFTHSPSLQVRADNGNRDVAGCCSGIENQQELTMPRRNLCNPRRAGMNMRARLIG